MSLEQPLSSPKSCHSPRQHDKDYVILQPYNNHGNYLNCCNRYLLIAAFCLFLLAAFVYLLWPSDPSVKIVRMRLNKIHVHTMPIINIDVALNLTIKVRNVDVYSMEFRGLDVKVRYRGKMLGHVRSDGGHVKAFGSSYVDAQLEFNGVGVLSDVVFLLEDLAKGTVPFDTVTVVDGKLGVFFFGFPLKAKLSCEILVNTNNQKIIRQSCSPER